MSTPPPQRPPSITGTGRPYVGDTLHGCLQIIEHHRAASPRALYSPAHWALYALARTGPGGTLVPLPWPDAGVFALLPPWEALQQMADRFKHPGYGRHAMSQAPADTAGAAVLIDGCFRCSLTAHGRAVARTWWQPPIRVRTAIGRLFDGTAAAFIHEVGHRKVLLNPAALPTEHPAVDVLAAMTRAKTLSQT